LPLFAAGGLQLFPRRRAAPPREALPPARAYVILWFDTEDYILPQSDDAAKRLAAFLTEQGIRATFKLVGEKARALERRGRRDAIGALAQHEIGYHSDTHSQHPTVAEYEAGLDWEGGIEEFDRRERRGYDDVRRIFAQVPSCYGQPGASWAPQSYPALHEWGVRVYLDDGRQVGLNGEPFWYGGLLNLFNLRDGAKLRPNPDWSNLTEAKATFQDIYLRLIPQSGTGAGGVVSVYFHPCEFIHREFWDAVNFARGANPASQDWKLPAVKTPDESEKAFRYFQDLITYIKSFPRVEFITATQALQLFRDTAQRRVYSNDELSSFAAQVTPAVSYQLHDRYVLAASEVFYLLSTFVAQVVRRSAPEPILLEGTPYGPASPPPRLEAKLEVPWSQFARTAADVQDFLKKNSQVPSAVWFGSRAVPPESYLPALAQAATQLLAHAEPPESVSLVPGELTVARFVAEDSPELWDWIIFPPGFHAPELMKLAKLQAWTLKPARLEPTHGRK